MLLLALQVAVAFHFGLMCILALYGSVGSVLRRFAPERAVPLPALGVSVLKPLHGLDPHLEENLKSFATLEAGVPYELLLLLDDEQDAAYPVAKAVEAAYPAVVRVLVGTTKGFANPKVASLHFGVPKAKHPLLWVADSNTEATPAMLESLRRAWARLQENGRVPSMVHAPVAAVRGSGLGARMERLQIAAYPNCSYEVCLLGGVESVIGKSLFLHREDLATVGGFERFASAGGEDYLMAKAMKQIGAVAYAREASRQVLGEDLSLRSYFDRQRRWATLRSHMTAPTFYLLEHFTLFGLPMVLCALRLLPVEWVAVALLVKAGLDTLLMRAHMGEWPSPIDVLLLPVKELVQFAAWVVAAFGKEVTWRGRILQFNEKGDYTAGTEEPVKPPAEASERP